jgi:hypothetical protein
MRDGERSEVPDLNATDYVPCPPGRLGSGEAGELQHACAIEELRRTPHWSLVSVGSRGSFLNTGPGVADNVRSVEDWQIIVEPGAVTIVEMVSKAAFGRAGSDLQVDRYVLDHGLLRTCTSEAEVAALLHDLGVAEAKAIDAAQAIWRESGRLPVKRG